MSWLPVLPRAAGAVATVLLITACSSPASMTPQQKEAYELRRYCEKNTNDVVKCNGYLGFL